MELKVVEKEEVKTVKSRKRTYVTEDGQEFKNKYDAEQHQDDLDFEKRFSEITDEQRSYIIKAIEIYEDEYESYEEECEEEVKRFVRSNGIDLKDVGRYFVPWKDNRYCGPSFCKTADDIKIAIVDALRDHDPYGIAVYDLDSENFRDSLKISIKEIELLPRS